MGTCTVAPGGWDEAAKTSAAKVIVQGLLALDLNGEREVIQ
jgi:hypothetical protein